MSLLCNLNISITLPLLIFEGMNKEERICRHVQVLTTQ